MAAAEVFTRAKCAATGAIACLSAEALRMGHIPGWEAVDGPLPEGPKSAVFKPAGDTPEETAGSASAKQTKKE